MTEQQGEQIIELLKQLNSRLDNLYMSVEAINREIGSIHLRAIKIENKL
jgi:hypothetical protein